MFGLSQKESRKKKGEEKKVRYTILTEEDEDEDKENGPKSSNTKTLNKNPQKKGVGGTIFCLLEKALLCI